MRNQVCKTKARPPWLKQHRYPRASLTEFTVLLGAWFEISLCFCFWLYSPPEFDYNSES